MEDVCVQDATFDAGAELNAFTARMLGAGAVVSFTGITRDLVDGKLTEMLIEHYPGMTEKALEGMRQDAMSRFSLQGARVIHRYGKLQAGDTIMMVATAARHRGDAFAAAEFLMDYLKSRAPFWKQEVTGDKATWVASKSEDETALKRW